MNRVPRDREVEVVRTSLDDYTYHIWENDEGGVTVLVGCHLGHFTADEAAELGRALSVAARRN